MHVATVEKGLQLVSFGCTLPIGGGTFAFPIIHVDRSQQADLAPFFLQHLIQVIACGAFAIGSGDPDDLKVPAWPVVEGRTHAGKERTGCFGDKVQDVFLFVCYRTSTENTYGTLGYSIVNIEVPLCMEARESKEYTPFYTLLGVIANFTDDLCLGKRGFFDAYSVQQTR
jgi:hypothetical protein